MLHQGYSKIFDNTMSFKVRVQLQGKRELATIEIPPLYNTKYLI